MKETKGILWCLELKCHTNNDQKALTNLQNVLSKLPRQMPPELGPVLGEPGAWCQWIRMKGINIPSKRHGLTGLAA